jgi:D-lactate dehydrogenase
VKILFDHTEAEERDTFTHALGSDHNIVFLETPICDAHEVGEHPDAQVLCVFVQSRIGKDVIDAMPNLQLIACRSMGYDHVDTAYAKQKGIVVVNVPAYGVRTVAEFAFALILALSRKAYAAYDRLREEGTTDVKHFEGFDLAGKTIGIIGTGNIGKNTARIANGFGMQILLADVRPDDAFAREVGGTYVTNEQLVAQSDIVSVHVPYLPATHHLINEQLLGQFKHGSYLINTARGAVVDTKALIAALKSGALAGAGLDVVEGEHELMDELSLLTDEHHDINEFQQLVMAHALVDMPNVVLTPHIAFNTREAKQEITDTTIQNITSCLAHNPQHTV